MHNAKSERLSEILSVSTSMEGVAKKISGILNPRQIELNNNNNNNVGLFTLKSTSYKSAIYYREIIICLRVL